MDAALSGAALPGSYSAKTVAVTSATDNYSLSNIPAAPMPPPTHIVTIP